MGQADRQARGRPKSRFFLAALYAASALITLRTRIVPLWLGIVTAILALASLVPFITWAVVIFATLIWIIILSIWLYLKRDATAATPAS